MIPTAQNPTMAAPQKESEKLRAELQGKKDAKYKELMGQGYVDPGSAAIGGGPTIYKKKLNNPLIGGTDSSQFNFSDFTKGVDREYNDRILELERQEKLNEKRDSATAPLKALQGRQAQRSEQFRMQFPSIAEKRAAEAKGDIRKQVASGIGQVRAGANARGLLYSGGRAGAEADVEQAGSDELNTRRGEINKELLDTQSALDQGVIDSGMQIAELESNYDKMDENYRKALQDAIMKRMQDQESNMADVGAGLGKAAGTAAASDKGSAWLSKLFGGK